jgi:hypothetical protein
MPSVRPSVFNQRARSDGGPFLLIEPCLEDDGVSVDVYFTDTPPSQRSGSYPIARLLNVAPEMVRIYPLHVRADRENYLQPRYGALESIALSRRIESPYPMPATVEDVEELLEMLPDGFSRDYRLGLGLLWEYRSICEALGDQGQVQLLIVHQGNEATFTPPTFVLGIRRFHEMRKEINRISARYQRDARRDKQLHAYHELFYAADPGLFPRLKKTLRADAIADATSGGRDTVMLSKRDRRAAVGLVRSNLDALAASETDALLTLKGEIEQVTLQQLIERFDEMLEKGLAESRWQSFLTNNPFILSLAFAVPAIIVEGQAYAGGKRLNGRGGKVADFLCASASTGNLAIVEIKKPGTDLLSHSAYRGDDVFAASAELSGTISQVLDQRVKLQRELPALKEASDRYDIHDFGIRCIVVAGRTPNEAPRRRSLELLRNAFTGVTVITFDELLARLKEIHDALGAKPEIAGPRRTPWSDHD